jgi:hypothetical protein
VWFDECVGICSGLSKLGTGHNDKLLPVSLNPPRVLSALAATDAVLAGEVIPPRPPTNLHKLIYCIIKMSVLIELKGLKASILSLYKVINLYSFCNCSRISSPSLTYQSSDF